VSLFYADTISLFKATLYFSTFLRLLYCIYLRSDIMPPLSNSVSVVFIDLAIFAAKATENLEAPMGHMMQLKMVACRV
jgi:hypothetical protein